MTTKSKQPRKNKQPKIGKIKLTERERRIIAKGIDSEFFKIIIKKIIPQREVQIALTLLHGGSHERDIYFYKGQERLMKWLPNFLAGEAAREEDITYDESDAPDASDDIIS